jgi:endonuclease-3
MPDANGPPPISTLLARLKKAYPEPRYELNWKEPLQLLVATILAAQCTDERVNRVTPALFAKYRTARDYAEADIAELQGYVKTISFCHKKAVAIQEACRALVERHGGEVPRTLEELEALPRVARKTANVVLANAFRIPTGVVVDAHVARVSRRLGLTAKKTPGVIEKDLMKLIPKDEWLFFGAAVVLHGRYTCTWRDPKCAECIFEDVCPRLGVGDGGADEAEAD